MLAMPDPKTFEIVPWRGEDAPTARMFCDIQHVSGDPFEGDPRQVLKRNLEKAREKGFTFYAGPEMEFFYFKSSETPRCRSTTPATSTSPRWTWSRNLRKQTIVTLEAMGIPVEYSFHELGSEPARDRPALHRRAHHGRQRDDVPARGQGGRAGPRRLRHVHAKADRWSIRLGHAHPLVAVRRRRQRVPRPRRRARLVEGRASPSSPACCTTAARSPRSPTSGSTRTSVSSSGTRRPSTSAGPATTAPRSCDVPVPKRGQGGVDTHRVPLTRPRVQPVPRILR